MQEGYFLVKKVGVIIILFCVIAYCQVKSLVHLNFHWDLNMINSAKEIKSTGMPSE